MLFIMRFLLIIIMSNLISCSKGDDKEAEGKGALIQKASSEHQTLKLAFVSELYGHPEIFWRNLNGGRAQRLTNTEQNIENVQPAVSPDGRKIAFISNRDGTDNLYVMDSDENSTRQLTSLRAPLKAGTPVWSPDGSQIAFVKTINKEDVFGRPLSREIFLISVDDRSEKQLTENWELGANRIDWQRKENKIIFITQKWGGINTVIIIDVNDPGHGYHVALPPTTNLAYFSFSPDSSRKLLCAGFVERQTHDIFVVENTDKSISAKRLTREGSPPANSRQPVWSPDGQLILFTSNRTGIDQLYVMDPKGENLRLISTSATREYDPVWFPTSN